MKASAHILNSIQKKKEKNHTIQWTQTRNLNKVSVKTQKEAFQYGIN
jgi:hypothetical protein